MLPTYPVIVGLAGGGGMPSFGDINWAMLVHGEQRVENFGEIPVEGTIVSTTRVVGIYDKGSGALAVMETESKYKDSGKPAFNTRFGAFIRGEGGFGESRGEELPARPKIPDTKADHEVTYATRPDQPLLYRLNGDRNPLHSDPAFAKLAGLPDARSSTACAPTASPVGRCCTRCAAPTRPSSRSWTRASRSPSCPATS